MARWWDGWCCEELVRPDRARRDTVTGSMTITLRPLGADDIGRVCALHNRAEHHDGVPRVLEVDELREELEGVSLELDTRLAELDGELAGYVYSFFLPSDTGSERAYLFGEVDPAFRGRGVGRALMRWAMDRGTEQLRSTGRALPKYLRVDTYDYIESAQRLFTRMGFEPVRWFEELLRPLTDLPSMREIPGVAFQPWPVDRDAETRAVKNAAFADHWGSAPTSESDWHRLVHGFGSRLDLSSVAVDGTTGEIVAVCHNRRYEADDELLGRRDGWIGTLGTLPEWRGRGIGSELVVRSLHAFLGAGCTHASLGVDAASPTGANQLYRRLGFELVQRSVTRQIEVR